LATFPEIPVYVLQNTQRPEFVLFFASSLKNLRNLCNPRFFKKQYWKYWGFFFFTRGKIIITVIIYVIMLNYSTLDVKINFRWQN